MRSEERRVGDLGGGGWGGGVGEVGGGGGGGGWLGGRQVSRSWRVTAGDRGGYQHRAYYSRAVAQGLRTEDSGRAR